MKNLRWLFGIALVITAGFYALNIGVYGEKQAADPPTGASQEFAETPLAPDVGTIAFVQRDGALLTLYTIRSDGTNKRMVYRNSDPVNSNIIDPEWTHDGRIEFIAMRDGTWKTFSIAEDGTGVSVIGEPRQSFALAEATHNDDLFFEAAPDDPLIHYFFYRNGGQKFKLDTVDLTACAQFCDPQFYLGEARLSPDKQHVIFEREAHIVIVKSDGSDYRQLTTGSNPVWK